MAQKTLAELQKMAFGSSDLFGVISSSSGRWVRAYQEFQNRPLEAIVIDTQDPSKLMKKSGVTKHGFFRTDQMYWVFSGNAEWIFLANGRKISFEQVQNLDYVVSEDLLLVHFSKVGANRVVLYNRDAKKVGQIEQVKRWVQLSNGIAFIVKTHEGEEVLQYSKGKMKSVFKNTGAIQQVSESGTNLPGLVISLKAEKGENQLVLKLDDKEYLLNDILDFRFESCWAEMSPVRNALLLTVLPQTIAKPKELVDIWYGNDAKLRDRRWHDRRRRLLWYPLEYRVEVVGGDVFENIASINHPGLFLAFNKYELETYTLYLSPRKYSLVNINGTAEVLDTVPEAGVLYFDPEGKWLLYPRRDGWYIYNLNTGKRRKTNLFDGLVKGPYTRLAGTVPYFMGRNRVLWINKGNVILHNLLTDRSTKLMSFNSEEIKVLNANLTIQDDSFVRSTSLKGLGSLILEVRNKDNRMVSYVQWKGNKMKVIVPETQKKIKNFVANTEGTKFTWIEEDFNSPPTLVSLDVDSDVRNILYETNREDLGIRNVQSKRMRYKGANGEELNGVLFLPAHLKMGRKYPVFTRIYEEMGIYSHNFLAPSFQNTLGVNYRLLLELDYLVFLPDISYSKKGPGLSALLCINNALDELVKIPEVDSSKIALYGQSFGGYETNFIATHSDRFATYISGASEADIVMGYYSFNINQSMPEYWRYEDQQFRMQTSLSNDKRKYLDNSPILFAKDVKKPVLLWMGQEDTNVDPSQTMSFYNALKRESVPTVALFYEGEGHTLANKLAQKDLTLRVIDWLDYFLKDKKDIPWINKQMKNSAIMK